MKRSGAVACPRASTLLNTELAMEPVECLDYIVVHELAHLPGWEAYRALLNRLPVRHQRW